MIPMVIDQFGLLDASILMGYVWADEPRASASVVTLGPDPSRVVRRREFLARRLWELRREFRFGVLCRIGGPVSRSGPGRSGHPVLISDSGDNPTAGGAGDVPFALERMLELGVENALVAGITDPGAWPACRRAGRGAGVALELGGKLDPLNGRPLRVTGQVIRLTLPCSDPAPATSCPTRWRSWTPVVSR